MATIEINGKKIEAEPGSMIIEVADKVGFQIPRFCYHKKLSIAANCRMCLVDIEKAPKALPACATPVTDGMKIWTNSPKAIMAQKAVMEFLLINHPLDCPICDQGGECELQDVAMGYGKDGSEYTEGKRSVLDKDIGPLIATDMTRCIQCTRCVRFGAEVAGVRELGLTGRGEHEEITTFIEKNMESEVSGNIIDLCPVGALTSKPYRFSARGWELTQKPSIAPHDCLGSHVFVHSRRGKVMRVVPKENEALNETWLSDRDRFSYEALYHEDRLLHPKIKRNGIWETVSWVEALEYAANLINSTAKTEANQIGALLSPNSTIEEAYLIQKLMRHLKSNNIDHRLRQADFEYQTAAPLCPSINVKVNDLEHLNSLLLIGSDIRKENPLLALKLRKTTLNHGKVMVINPIDVEMNFDVTAIDIVPEGDLVLGLASFVKAMIENELDKANSSETSRAQETSKASDYAHWLKKLEQVIVTDKSKTMLNHFTKGEKSLILLGALAEHHPYYSEILWLTQILSEITGAKIGLISEGANAAGCWLSGAIPHRIAGGARLKEAGLNAKQMLDKPLNTYLLWNVDPELDCAEGIKALKTLSRADSVISITVFESETLRDVSTVMLPLSAFTENEGNFCNCEGNWQTFEANVAPLGESRPGWKILRVLGTVLGVTEFEYETREQVLEDLACDIAFNPRNKRTGINRENHLFDNPSNEQLINWQLSIPEQLHFISKAKSHVLTSESSDKQSIQNTYLKIAQVPLYASDNLVRRSAPLQKMNDRGIVAVQLNTAMAEKLNIKTLARITYLENSLTLPVMINDRIADDTILIPMSMTETLSLGGSYVQVGVKPC